jgi:hypothetical protein
MRRNYTVCEGGADASVQLPRPGAADDYSASTASSLSYNKDLVIDGSPPTVVEVTSDKADGTYGVGEVIFVQVIFTAPVEVTFVPELLIETGSIDRTAVFHSQPAPNMLQFKYTVLSGDVSNDLNYAGINALSLGTVPPFATVKRKSTNSTTDAVLTLAAQGKEGALMFNKAIVIESAPARIVAVDSDHANGVFGAGEAINVSCTFDQPVTVTGVPRLPMEGGSIDLYPGHVLVKVPVDGSLYVYEWPNIQHSLRTAKDAGRQFIINGQTLTVVSVAGNKVTMKEAWTGPPVAPPVVASGTLPPKYTRGVPGYAIMTPNRREAKYHSGSGTKVLAFTYVVERGDYNLDLDLLMHLDNGVVHLAIDAMPINLGQALMGVTTTGTETATMLRTSTTPSLAVSLIPAEDASPVCGITSGVAGQTSTGAPCKNLAARKAIVINDRVPVVIKVTSTKMDGTYRVGETIDFQVTFDLPIAVKGVPTLRLDVVNTDGAPVLATYAAGSGTHTAIFNYTVRAGDASMRLGFAGTDALSTYSTSDPAYIRRRSTFPTTDVLRTLPMLPFLSDHTWVMVTGIDASSVLTYVTVSSGVFVTNDIVVVAAKKLPRNLFTNAKYYARLLEVGGAALTLHAAADWLGTFTADVTTDVITPAAMGTTARGDIVQLGATEEFYGGTVGTADYHVRLESATTLMLHTVPAVACQSSTANVVTADAHGLAANDLVRVDHHTYLLTGAVATTDYYVRYLSDNTFTLHTVPVLAIGGAGRIDMSARSATTAGYITTATAHGLTGATGAGQPVYVSGTIPANSAGMVTGTVYYAVAISTVIFTLHTALTATAGATGNIIDFSSAADLTAAQTLYVAPEIVSLTDNPNPVTAFHVSNMASKVVFSGTPAGLQYMARKRVEAEGGIETYLAKDTGNAAADVVYKNIVVDTAGGTVVPYVKHVTTPTLSGTYGVGEIIQLKVEFSAAVEVVGEPFIRMESGVIDRPAPYKEGTGTTTLTFQYVVQLQDTSALLDYQLSNADFTATTVIHLNGGTIKKQVSCTINGNSVVTITPPGALVTGALVFMTAAPLPTNGAALTPYYVRALTVGGAELTLHAAKSLTTYVVDSDTNIVTPGHGVSFANNDIVELATGGTLPSGTSSTTSYYVRNLYDTPNLVLSTVLLTEVVSFSVAGRVTLPGTSGFVDMDQIQFALPNTGGKLPSATLNGAAYTVSSNGVTYYPRKTAPDVFAIHTTPLLHVDSVEPTTEYFKKAAHGLAMAAEVFVGDTGVAAGVDLMTNVVTAFADAIPYYVSVVDASTFMLHTSIPIAATISAHVVTTASAAFTSNDQVRLSAKDEVYMPVAGDSGIKYRARLVTVGGTMLSLYVEANWFEFTVSIITDVLTPTNMGTLIDSDQVQLGASVAFHTNTDGASTYHVRLESATTLMLHALPAVACQSIAAGVVTSAAHGLAADHTSSVRLALTNLPAGGSAATDYYVRYLSPSTFTLHTSVPKAIIGSGNIDVANNKIILLEHGITGTAGAATLVWLSGDLPAATPALSSGTKYYAVRDDDDQFSLQTEANGGAINFSADLTFVQTMYVSPDLALGTITSSTAFSFSDLATKIDFDGSPTGSWFFGRREQQLMGGTNVYLAKGTVDIASTLAGTAKLYVAANQVKFSDVGSTQNKAVLISKTSAHTLDFTDAGVGSQWIGKNKVALQADGNAIFLGRDPVVVLPRPSLLEVATWSRDGYRTDGTVVQSTYTEGSVYSLAGLKTIVVNTTSPQVLDVFTGKLPGVYGVGEKILINVKFSAPVAMWNLGTPKLDLETGDTNTDCVLHGGSGTDTLTFLYNVAARDGNSDLEYAHEGALRCLEVMG